MIERFRTCKACKLEKPIEKFPTMGKKKQHVRRRTCNKCLNRKYRDYRKKYHKDHYEKRPPRFRWVTATEEQCNFRLRDLFEGAVIKNAEGCWDWKRKLHKTGYTMIRYDKLQTSGHRVSWLLHKGVIPDGLIVCHKCDNKKCTNPSHLFLGTHKDNHKDMVNKERHPGIKLTVSKVKEIKNLLALGVTGAKLSRDFKVSPRAISSIKCGKAWKHVKI